MKPRQLAWRSLVGQPARAVLGIVGIAVVGALLFDMLLLSRGLVVSFGEILTGVGFDVRVTSTPALPTAGPPVERAQATATEILELPEIELAVPLRLVSGVVERGSESEIEYLSVSIMGVDTAGRGYWKLLDGRDLRSERADDGASEVIVNRSLADHLGVAPGDALRIRGRCDERRIPLAPVTARIVGIARFPFDSTYEMTLATALADLRPLCGETEGDVADVLLVASRGGTGSQETVAAIQRLRPDLHVFSNEQLLRRFEQRDFSYFRQISIVLASVTLFFAFLLIAALLTVSVNQRFAEIAALRALGFSRRRVAADLMWESALLVGVGGTLALPLGGLFAYWLDGILRQMPYLPADLHFFVFEPRAILIHVVLLTTAATIAAAYPVYLVVRLPIAATLRREIVS